MTAFERKPYWYKDAVIYEAHVKSYFDSDGDGVGDFRGLIGKLDYIRDLGVDTIWLLPFYPSPLRDDGYDIADYRSVNPVYGNLETFKEFLSEAHARGLKVVTEVVINHTSDKHPWFERARRAPAGSPERDFYVWSASKEKYGQARIIFKDYEPSNWTWDPVARSHFWHRFYHHQPDLNFDNPAVHDAVLEVLDYWLEMGVDGLRLDAIPYLYEREGTSCENLAETHAFLRKLTAHVNAKFDNRMLLAEANQWPDDAAAYFGAGDSCNVAFHFPLMTRLYMAVETEDRFPMVDILDQTPAIPDNCQWAVFLRNHDELTLEMVTDEERDYMYRMFARDRRARINLGIRRRLAPLLGNNRRKIELMNALLFSLPGTPVLYYGDEIGMGDNIYLGDRDGVRTPMQWSADRNAGFSRAPAQRLYLPVIADSEHHYEAVNVEAQEANPSSLLWWMRRRIRLRQAHPVFGRGSIRFLAPENAHVLAYIRETEDEAILVVANLSQHPQAAHLDLDEFRGAEPFELAGGARFPAVGSGPWPVMLGGHDCLWLQLRARQSESLAVRMLPDAGEWKDLESLVTGGSVMVAWLEAYVVRAPWFLGKNRLLSRVSVREKLFPVGPEYALLVIRMEFLIGDPEDYLLWLGFSPAAEQTTDITTVHAAQVPSHACIANVRLGGVSGELCEAQHLPSFRAELVSHLLHPTLGDKPLALGHLTSTQKSWHVHIFPGAELARPPARAPSQLVETDSSEFRIVIQGRILLRWFRRLSLEARPDLDVLQVVKSRFPKARVPQCLVRADYSPSGSRSGSEGRLTMGYVQRFVHADRTVRDLAQEGLQYFLRGAEVLGPTLEDRAVQSRPGLAPRRVDFQTLDPALQTALGSTWCEFAYLLGQRLAELHRTLARCGTVDPGFTPEPFTLLHQYSLFHSIRARLRRALAHPEKLGAHFSSDLSELSARAVAAQPTMVSGLKKLIVGKIQGERLRVHGNLRLDRVLFTGKDYVFTSFDGPPWLTRTEQGHLLSPLHDVAALMHALLRFPLDVNADRPELRDGLHLDDDRTRKFGEWWAEVSAGLVLDGYLDAADKERWLPQSEEHSLLLLDSFILERLAHEIQSAAVDPVGAESALRVIGSMGPR